MEIRVEERMTGEALRDRILSRYGSREALEDQASHRASQDRGEETDQEGDRSGQSGQSGQSGRPGQSEVDATPETGRRSGPEPDSDPGTDSGPNRGLDPDRSSDPDPEPSPDPDTAQAQADLATLRTLEEDPDRLDARMRIARTTLLEPEDLADLTPARLQLLPALAENREAGRNITELADHLDRDKKNVSEDVEVLQHLGLADARRDGRSKIPFLPDAEIAIRIDPTEDAGGVDGLGGGPVARAG